MTVEISASLVKELRERSGVSMMECKKALVATNGNLDAAIEFLRKSGQAKAVKKEARVAAEGLITVAVTNDNKRAAIVEVNCETDFVARETQFRQFANNLTQVALQKQIADVSQLLATPSGIESKTMDNVRIDLITQLGENIAVRRITLLEATTGVVGAYVHGNSDGARIASLVSIDVPNLVLAKDLAMQLAAMKPEYISLAHIPQERYTKETAIFMAQVQETEVNKPKDIITKIVQGKVQKYLQELTLLGQTFVKDNKQTVEQLLNQAKAKVIAMVRYEVGEGLSKKATDFVTEVMEQVQK